MVPAAPALLVHPRRTGWRAGAAAALLEQSVTALRCGRSPRTTVEQLLALGAHDLPAGLAAAAVAGCPHPGE